MNKLLLSLLLSTSILVGCDVETITETPDIKEQTTAPVIEDDYSTDNTELSEAMSEIPQISDLPLSDDYVIINDNIPNFSNEEIANTEAYVDFSTLDYLGRTGMAQGLLDVELMPSEQRGSISSIYPSGWNQGNYDHIASGGWLYNRSHLIGHQLTGDDNPENLMTGTRQFNVDGMLPFENYVANYIEDTENQVLYRVTPIYEGNNLLAHGLQMEAYSPYDDGEGVQMNVFVPNQQDGISLDYATGSHQEY